MYNFISLITPFGIHYNNDLILASFPGAEEGEKERLVQFSSKVSSHTHRDTAYRYWDELKIDKNKADVKQCIREEKVQESVSIWIEGQHYFHSSSTLSMGLWWSALVTSALTILTTSSASLIDILITSSVLFKPSQSVSHWAGLLFGSCRSRLHFYFHILFSLWG